MIRYTAYYAGSVRGKNGDSATLDEIADNLECHRNICHRLRIELPEWRIYCPHESVNEDVYQQSWRAGILESDQILAHSIEIVLSCIHGIFLGNSEEESAGVKLECEAARAANIPVIEIYKHLPDWAKVTDAVRRKETAAWPPRSDLATQ